MPVLLWYDDAGTTVVRLWWYYAATESSTRLSLVQGAGTSPEASRTATLSKAGSSSLPWYKHNQTQDQQGSSMYQHSSTSVVPAPARHMDHSLASAPARYQLSTSQHQCYSTLPRRQYQRRYDATHTGGVGPYPAQLHTLSLPHGPPHGPLAPLPNPALRRLRIGPPPAFPPLFRALVSPPGRNQHVSTRTAEARTCMCIVHASMSV
eukprot:3021039-Rhodomonas_salina.2